VMPVELTDGNMDAYVKSSKLPVLVDFFSPTCGPCITLAPVLKTLAKKFHRKVVIATVDTSRSPGCSAFYQIKGVPTLIFFKNGDIIDQITGLPDLSLLESKLDYISR
jgi:thioredoxin